MEVECLLSAVQTCHYGSHNDVCLIFGGIEPFSHIYMALY